MDTSKEERETSRLPGTGLKKLVPKCKPPTGAVLRKLSASEAQRLRLRLTETLECVYLPDFGKAGAQDCYAKDVGNAKTAPPRLVSAALSQTKDNAQRLTRDEESELFLRYNYCRYRMMRILKAFSGKRITAAGTRELLSWDHVALDVRDAIVQTNLGLVPSMVERSRLTGVDFAELISEGQLALLRSVDKFDCTRGFKFSTYACRAILTSISRAVSLMARYRTRFPIEYDPDLQKGDTVEVRREDTEEVCVRELSRMLAENTADLTATERKVLAERFGVQGTNRTQKAEPKTLRQVAEVFGVTKERVRQIQNKALGKLREAMDEQIFAA